MSITITEKAIKNKVKAGERVAVVENIKYPFFESQKYKKLCERMNEFYCSVAEKYSRLAEGKLLRRAEIGKGVDKPYAVGMKYTVALCNEKVVSVVLDLSFSDGKSFKTRRFSQMWSCKEQNILRLSEIIKTDRRSKKKIFSLVITAAKKNKNNSVFGYFDDYLKRLSRKFDINNCFAVPRGMCFFVNAGILSPANHGADSFMLTSEELKDVLVCDFMPEEDENRRDDANIVNNI